ncbi:MAG: hypothetical protein JSV05_06885 [Candidatus Bathyarchaeota archaeon]|nr:MAG: hypothetical protein JSV05_06885 [Candidatus Bathyarchaeota archaeon]
MTRLASKNLREEHILNLCKKMLQSKEIFSACYYGPKVYGKQYKKTDINALLIMQNPPSKIRNFNQQIAGINLNVLVVDKKVFEADVNHGEFGEFAAEIVAFPYAGLINISYLEKMEVELKKRFIQELLENTILQYPELSLELLIQPEYFMYEVIRKKMRFFPPSRYYFIDIFTTPTRTRNIKAMMNGYSKALQELEKENFITLSNGFVKINSNFIENTKRKKSRLAQISKALVAVQKALLPYIRGVSSRIVTTFLLDQRFYTKEINRKAERDFLKQLEETERFLLVPTPLGPIPLSDETNIEEFIRKTVPGTKALRITIKEMGGVLNSVFLLEFQNKNRTKRVIVKRFEDWLGFKWFPLALWTLGTKSFAVSGASRLEREYSINQFLRKHGFLVPSIIYVSLKERLLFTEFVEGDKLTEIIREIISLSPKHPQKKNTEIIKAAGRAIAKAHLLGVTFGDCKPENILITKDNDLCFLDLEQAARNGNESWDIAEFLYYSGHYIFPIHSEEAARIITSSFIEGYLEAGGKKEIIKEVASAKYTKVFSIFTLPHIILLIADICKRVGEINTG